MPKEKMTVIRKILPSDIADYERWFREDTEWMNWDAPWEEWTDNEISEFIEKLKIAISKDSPVLYRMEIDDGNGKHIGWVSSYDMHDGLGLAVGVDIPPKESRGLGHGERALRLFMKYLFEKTNADKLYTQTWSGNTPMIKVAEKLGFVICNLRPNIRPVGGRLFDALTFECKIKDFFRKRI